MRERRNFAERTKILKSDQVNRKYFLVFEGKNTEQIYFEAINNNRDFLKLNPLIELVPLLRSYSEENWSNPKKLIDRVVKNLQEKEQGIVSVNTLLDWIIDYFIDEKIIKSGKSEAKYVWNILTQAVNDEISLTLDDVISKIDIDDICTKIITYYISKSSLKSIVNIIPEILQHSDISYVKGIDKICFIVDRDKESFVSDQYKYVMNMCKKEGFGFYLSNPCFEFWLLLHFDEVKKLDINKLLENSKVTSSRRYAECELRKLLPRYSKSKYSAYDLLSRIDMAIANEKDYCEDEANLEKEVGSRVGILIEELRKKDI